MGHELRHFQHVVAPKGIKPIVDVILTTRHRDTRIQQLTHTGDAARPGLAILEIGGDEGDVAVGKDGDAARHKQIDHLRGVVVGVDGEGGALGGADPSCVAPRQDLPRHHLQRAQ